MSQVSVFLIEPHRLLREGIKSLLLNTSFRVEGESGDWSDGITALEQRNAIDIVLLELPHDSRNVLTLLRAVHRAAPDAKIVILTTIFDRSLLANAAEMGICGLLQKNISPGALMHSLELVMLCERVFPIHGTFLPTICSDATVAAPFGDAEGSELTEGFGDLSPREIEILRNLADGRSNKQIGRELNVAETTVKAHIKTILRKIKLRNRTQAAIWYLTKAGERAATGHRFDRRVADGSAASRSQLARLPMLTSVS